MLYVLIIKGNQAQATQAAARHDLEFTFEREVCQPAGSFESVGKVSIDQCTKLVDWFTEDICQDPPFPSGTLLYYHPLPKVH